MSQDENIVKKDVPLKEGYQPKSVQKKGDPLEKGYQPNQGSLDRTDPPKQEPVSSSSDSESDS
ncbi:MAG: hypothetical protein IIB94_14220 [Candidatus Marinimicrobia bacterium]|nr:hypothetical protein [Candidatus Neomarinimicrobiota bacterium]